MKGLVIPGLFYSKTDQHFYFYYQYCQWSYRVSIIYTSLVLVAGFVIFVFSNFGGTKALGWLTSFTLLIATFNNLIFLPVIMLALLKKKKKASENF